MFKNHQLLVSCLTLALFMAGFSNAHAAIVIDSFDGPDQQAPPDNEIDAPSAIGGKRFLTSVVESQTIVSNGLWQSLEQNPPGGVVSVIYRGDGTLGGIDLTEGGLNTAFEIAIVARSSFKGETLTLTVDDSDSGNSSFSVDWVDLPFSGSYLIPFSSLAGDADLTSVDIITVANTIPGLTGETVLMAIDAISAGAGSPPPSGIDLTGTVQDQGGTPLCSLALASGQFVFTCNPNGPYELLDLPTESDGTVKRQVYVDGFFPNVETLTGSTDETVVMTRANNCPDYNSFPEPGVFPGSAGKQINVSGTILQQNTQTAVCAMALASGQFGFTCDGMGTYSATIPLDANGQYKLQVYAEGFAPMVQAFDEFTPDVEVRLARAAECQ